MYNATVPANRLISVSACKAPAQYSDNGFCYVTNKAMTVNTSYKMMLIDKGSYTTWMSMSKIAVINAFLYDGYFVVHSQTNINYSSRLRLDSNTYYYDYGGTDDYSTSHLRHFLNNFLFTIIPSVLRNNIKTVKKRYIGLSNPQGTNARDVNSNSLLDKSTDEKIWVPSISEVYTLLKYGANTKTVSDPISDPTIERLYTMDKQQTDFTANKIVRDALATIIGDSVGALRDMAKTSRGFVQTPVGITSKTVTDYDDEPYHYILHVDGLDYLENSTFCFCL